MGLAGRSTQYADPNFIKVFQLSQLMIEYCLYSQEVIDEARLNLQSEYETQKAKVRVRRRRMGRTWAGGRCRCAQPLTATLTNRPWADPAISAPYVQADKLAKSDKEQKDQITMLKKELKLQRKTIAVYEDRCDPALVLSAAA